MQNRGVEVTSFKEFLKKEKTYFADFTEKEEYLSMHALGEWAWERWENSFNFDEESKLNLEWLKLSLKQRKKEMERLPEEPYEGSGISLATIAEACLGEKEVKKRLEGLK